VRVQGLNIALRPRPSWEAVDLGVALVRRHAGPIFGSWLLVTGLCFVALNALLLPFDLAWLAALLLWWLKPAFDRIPLHVLSRAIMGQSPGVRDTLRALRGGWRPLLPWLLWRRLHPLRSMLLAVDLLEGAHGAGRGARVRVLSAGEGSTPLLLTVIGLHLELMLWGSAIAFGLMLVPTEFLSDSAEALFDAMKEQPPWWMQALNNGIYWVALSVIEPFYVGAGFALYLNRRTLLEAWDIELAFRRLAARLARTAVAVLLAGTLLLPAAELAARPALTAADKNFSKTEPDKPWHKDAEEGPAAKRVPADIDDDEEFESDPNPFASDAQDDESRESEAAAAAVTPLTDLFEPDQLAPDAEFSKALEQALADPDLNPKQSVGRWRLRNDDGGEDADAKAPAWAVAVGNALALVFENVLWILLAVALVLLVVHRRRWLPWFFGRDAARVPAPPAGAIREQASAAPLPPDLAGAVLALWRSGDARGAMSLFYRGALAGLVERLGVALLPGATEDESLRHARRIAAQPFAMLFRRIVLRWQAVAYAHRAPSESELLELVEAWRALEPPA
jgi:hypothetical protein